MSADNWAVCPRCHRQYVEIAAKVAADVEAAYGNVPAEQYLDMLKNSQKPKEEEGSSFREYYELGVSADGSFYVRYSGRCTVCGLRHEFKFDNSVSMDQPDTSNVPRPTKGKRA